MMVVWLQKYYCIVHIHIWDIHKILYQSKSAMINCHILFLVYDICDCVPKVLYWVEKLREQGKNNI